MGNESSYSNQSRKNSLEKKFQDKSVPIGDPEWSHGLPENVIESIGSRISEVADVVSGNINHSSTTAHTSKDKLSNDDDTHRKDEGGIVVVSKGKRASNAAPGTRAYHDSISRGDPSQDELMIQLNNIPFFYPVVKSSVTLSGLRSSSSNGDHLYFSDIQTPSVTVNRLKEHLKSCSEAVAFDQASLVMRIKEIDSLINGLNDNLIEKQKRYSRYADQVQKINELSSILGKTKLQISHLESFMNELNLSLPEDEQLESIDYHPLATMKNQNKSPSPIHKKFVAMETTPLKSKNKTSVISASDHDDVLKVILGTK